MVGGKHNQDLPRLAMGRHHAAVRVMDFVRMDHGVDSLRPMCAGSSA
jgi:hypothetical protein